MEPAWLIYLVAAIAMWMFIAYCLNKLLPLVHTLLLSLPLLAILLTPINVPETSSVSPAWLAAFYEAMFGDMERAARAFRPLLWTMSLSLLPSLGYMLWRIKKLALPSQSSSPSAADES